MIRPPRAPASLQPERDEPDVQPPSSAIQPTAEDARLVAAVRAAEGGAAAAFYDRLRGRVDSTIRRILGGRDVDHADLMQLTMLELISSIDRFRGEASLDAWASGVTAHVVYNHLRRRKLERRIFSGAEPPSDPTSTSMFRTLVARDSVRKIRELLDDMDEAKAWTFVLHDVCGFDLREIASITGVTVGAAQRRLVRGRDELHERIAADPVLANVLRDMESEA